MKKLLAIAALLAASLAHAQTPVGLWKTIDDETKQEKSYVRIVESDEDVLLYDMGHISGAINLDWHTDLQDQVKRDFLDRAGFEELMEAQKGRGRRAWKGSAASKMKDIYQQIVQKNVHSEFVGYDRLKEKSPVAAMIRRRRGRHPTAEVDGAQALETAADTVIGSPPPAVRFSGRTPRRRGADARATPRPSRCRLKVEATPAAAVPPEGGSHTCR